MLRCRNLEEVPGVLVEMYLEFCRMLWMWGRQVDLCAG